MTQELLTELTRLRKLRQSQRLWPRSYKQYQLLVRETLQPTDMSVACTGSPRGAAL